MSPSTRTNASDLFDLSAEPPAIERLTPRQKDRLTEILDRYFSGLEKGLPPSREELLAADPDLAGPLRTYLDRLDELHDAAAGFAQSAYRPHPEEDPAPADQQRRLGDFRLLREIGRGGMGVVYEAQQLSLGRRVALKVLPFAAVLDARQIARFKHEAQAAAQLDHPNIVSVFAIGMERGVHYYAMQFVEGQPLDRALAELRTVELRTVELRTAELRQSGGSAPTAGYEGASDARPDPGSVPTVDYRPAPSTSRLAAGAANSTSLLGAGAANQEYFRTVAQLGIQAAEALHAAHEHGIVHRDVKPSNLLLDGNGKLWVTDFGLARCRSDVNLTRTGDLVGTLRYMSPEQATGQSALVDQRTDVYSLGVTLYELIALQPAFSGEDGPALLRQIGQQEPRPLRQLQAKVPADLETVVSKAMAKRREERYTTARELADDLHRVLAGKPTVARPPTALERVGRWARRHRGAVAVAVAVCLFAVLGMVASTLLIAREKTKAEQNYARAEKCFREAQDAVDRLGKRLAERLADVPGAEQVRKDLLRETLRYYGSFVDQAKDNPALRADLALTYSKIGTLNAEMGLNDEAIAAHQSAIGLFQQLAAGSPHEPDYRRRLAISWNNLALALGRVGRTDDAGWAYREAIRLQAQLAEESGDAAECLADLALSHNNLGLLQSETGEAADAEHSLREAKRLQQRLLELKPGSPEPLRDLATSLNNLSSLYAATQPDRAAEWYATALDHQTKAAAMRPGELKYQSDVAATCNNLGAVQSRAGRLPQAAASYARAVEIQGRLVQAAPEQKFYQRDLAVSLNNLGMVQSKLHATADAERSFRRALELQEPLVRENPHDVELQSNLGGIYNNLGMVLEQQRRYPEVAESYRQAVDHQQIASSRAPQVPRYRAHLSKHYYNYGRVLWRLGRADEAVRIALARRDLWPADPQHLFAVAEELALATRQLARSPAAKFSPQRCAELAMETLRKAAAAGWKPPPGADWTASFAALKDQPGFAELAKR